MADIIPLLIGCILLAMLWLLDAIGLGESRLSSWIATLAEALFEAGTD
jgi:hypothetical protein